MKKYNFIYINNSIFSSCTKFFIGSPELGSKNNPIKVFVSEKNLENITKDNIENFQNCFDKSIGFKLELLFLPHENNIFHEMIKEKSYFAVTNILNYFELHEKIQIKSNYSFIQKSFSSQRSIILANTQYLKNILKKHNEILNSSFPKNDETLESLNKAKAVFNSPEDLLGFILPRMYLYHKNIFPNSVYFSGSYEAVLESINLNKANFGAVNQIYLEKKYPEIKNFTIGSNISNFIVIGYTQSLPNLVLIEKNDTPKNALNAIIKGFQFCSINNSSDFKNIFNSENIQKNNEKDFVFAKELYEFQKENTRILNNYQSNNY